MSELEPKPFLPGNETSAEGNGVQFQLNLLRAGLILMSALFAAFIWVQVHYLRLERANFKPLVESFDRDRATLDGLLVKIGDYSRTHPSFVPIMQKYQIQPPTNVTPVAKPAAPAAPKPSPAPATTPKK